MLLLIIIFPSCWVPVSATKKKNKQQQKPRRHNESLNSNIQTEKNCTSTTRLSKVKHIYPSLLWSMFGCENHRKIQSHFISNLMCLEATLFWPHLKIKVLNASSRTLILINNMLHLCQRMILWHHHHYAS